MGVNISEIIPKKEISLKDLKGKVVAIDAFNTLYQFLTTIRQSDGTPLMNKSGDVTSHLSGLFYRNISLLTEGIKPIYVFDGKPPEMKKQESERRTKVKEQAHENYEKAKSQEDVEGMRKYAAQTVKMTDKIIEQSKKLLTALGIPVIQAPGEGEAEASYLTKNKQAWATASQDYDVLLYGAPKLIRNLTLARRRRIASGAYIPVEIELIEFEDVLNKLQIEQDQLICLGILVGTDYNPGGVRGIGQKRALEIVKKYQYPIKIFEYIKNNEKLDLNFDWSEIYKQFKEYNCTLHPEIEFKKPDEKIVKEILLENDFSIERIESGLRKLKEIEEKNKQKGLGEFW